MFIKNANYPARPTEPNSDQQSPISHYQAEHDKHTQYRRQLGQYLQQGLSPRVSPYTAAVAAQYPRFIIRNSRYDARSSLAYRKLSDGHQTADQTPCDREHGKHLVGRQRSQATQGTDSASVHGKIPTPTGKRSADATELEGSNSNAKHSPSIDAHSDNNNRSSTHKIPDGVHPSNPYQQQRNFYSCEYHHRLPTHIRVHKQPLYTDFQQTYRESLQRGDAYFRQVRRFMHLPPEVKQQLLPHEDDQRHPPPCSKYRLNPESPIIRHRRKSRRPAAADPSTDRPAVRERHDRRALASQNSAQSKSKAKASHRSEVQELEFLHGRIRFLEDRIRQLHHRLDKIPVDRNDRESEHHEHPKNEASILHPSTRCDTDKAVIPTALTVVPETILDESSSKQAPEGVSATDSERRQFPIQDVQDTNENLHVSTDQAQGKEKTLNEDTTIHPQECKKVVVILRKKAPAAQHQPIPRDEQVLSLDQKPTVYGPEPPPHRTQRAEIFNSTDNQSKNTPLSDGAKQHGKEDRSVRVVEGNECHLTRHNGTSKDASINSRYTSGKDKTGPQQNADKTNRIHSSSSESENTDSSSSSSSSSNTQ